MTNQRRRAAVRQLKFFIAPRIQRLRRRERWIFRFGTDSGVEEKGQAASAARPHRLPGIQAALGLRPRRALSSAEARLLFAASPTQMRALTAEAESNSGFGSTESGFAETLSGFARTSDIKLFPNPQISDQKRHHEVRVTLVRERASFCMPLL